MNDNLNVAYYMVSGPSGHTFLRRHNKDKGIHDYTLRMDEGMTFETQEDAQAVCDTGDFVVAITLDVSIR